MMPKTHKQTGKTNFNSTISKLKNEKGSFFFNTTVDHSSSIHNKRISIFHVCLPASCWTSLLHCTELNHQSNTNPNEEDLTKAITVNRGRKCLFQSLVFQPLFWAEPQKTTAAANKRRLKVVFYVHVPPKNLIAWNCQMTWDDFKRQSHLKQVPSSPSNSNKSTF